MPSSGPLTLPTSPARTSAPPSRPPSPAARGRTAPTVEPLEGLAGVRRAQEGQGVLSGQPRSERPATHCVCAMPRRVRAARPLSRPSPPPDFLVCAECAARPTPGVAARVNTPQPLSGSQVARRPSNQRGRPGRTPTLSSEVVTASDALLCTERVNGATARVPTSSRHPFSPGAIVAKGGSRSACPSRCPTPQPRGWLRRRGRPDRHGGAEIGRAHDAPPATKPPIPGRGFI